MARDSQRGKVYKWEKVVFAPQWKDASLTQQGAINLFNACLIAGGKDPARYTIKFTKRRGGACAGPREANFTPGRLMPILVIHEAAHALTWRRFEAEDVRDDQGHGPRYVACYLALIERFLGLDLTEAMRTLRQGFEVVEKKLVPTGVVEMRQTYLYRSDGTKSLGRVVPHELHKWVERLRKVNPPKYDAAALKLWREKLKESRA